MKIFLYFDHFDLNLLLELLAITVSCVEYFFKLMDLGREGNKSIMLANIVIKLLYVHKICYYKSSDMN